MRVLIVSMAAMLACAYAAPSHVALAYGAGAVLSAHAPTISPGDLQGAAIDAHVEASDVARAALDAGREYHDQAAELHGRAINAAEDHSWQAADAVSTHQAQLDGAAAGAAPVLAKQLTHAAYAAPVAAPLAYAAPVAAPLAYAAPVAAPLAYTAPVVAPNAYAAPLSLPHHALSYSHVAPLIHAPQPYAHAW